jgi:hypothetical protein
MNKKFDDSLRILEDLPLLHVLGHDIDFNFRRRRFLGRNFVCRLVLLLQWLSLLLGTN